MTDWKKLFDQLNKDDPANARPYADVEYYAQQIHNLTDEVDYEAAYQLALNLNKQ